MAAVHDIQGTCQAVNSDDDGNLTEEAGHRHDLTRITADTLWIPSGKFPVCAAGAAIVLVSDSSQALRPKFQTAAVTVL